MLKIIKQKIKNIQGVLIVEKKADYGERKIKKGFQLIINIKI